MAITFEDADELIEFALEYTSLGRMTTDQIDELRNGERLPSDRLSEDAVLNYIIPFLTTAWLDRGFFYPDLKPNENASLGEEFMYLAQPKLDSFTVRVTVQVSSEDEWDAQSIDSRIRNALETEGLNMYTDLQVMKA